MVRRQERLKTAFDVLRSAGQRSILLYTCKNRFPLELFPKGRLFRRFDYTRFHDTFAVALLHVIPNRHVTELLSGRKNVHSFLVMFVFYISPMRTKGPTSRYRSSFVAPCIQLQQETRRKRTKTAFYCISYRVYFFLLRIFPRRPLLVYFFSFPRTNYHALFVLGILFFLLLFSLLWNNSAETLTALSERNKRRFFN